MRICHVNLASGYSGGENQTLNLIKQQLKQNYQLAVVANPKSPFYTKCEELPLELIPCTHFLTRHSLSISKNYPLIHTHEGRAVYWALIQYLFYRTPYILTRRVDNLLKDKYLLRLAYTHAHKVVALSRAIKLSVQKTIPEVTPDIIPSSPVIYPISSDQREALQPFLITGKFSVIQVGKLYQHKGFDLTIQAAIQLANSHPDIHFYLLGDGPEESSLKSQAQGLSNISFVGKQNNVGAWFEAADLLIHPSYTEGLGSVILEASAAGLPLIGSSAGGIPDIIQHEQNGLLFKSGDASALAESILRIYGDQTLRDQFEKNSAKILDKFSIERCAAHYEALYRSALSQSLND